MEENNHCIYRHLKPCGEVFYIGIGKDLKRPYNKTSRSKYWKKVVDKYGYEVQILKFNLLKEEACELEKLLISWYGRKDMGEGLLINMTDGGDGTLRKSEETRRKISEAQKGSKNHAFGLNGEKNPNFGNKWSDEQKEKARVRSLEYFKTHEATFKGRTHSEESRRKISDNANKPCNCDHYFSKEVINLQTGVVHCSSAEASDTYGFKRSTLKSMLNGANPNRTDLRYLDNLENNPK
jgi:hypothetical protein